MGDEYVRIEAVIYVKLKEGQTQEDAEDMLLDALPECMDCANLKSSYWVEE